ncbi:hypothetical protein LR48_Vigan01g085300 [Vigna angularis]|uniref:Uncharacterized protein n=1 Tax=Phaseolus angularis TaxID=3914 RepID=A0A0L9TL30_PHAAN|nr:hypothetical protein LR48_Vigan01g085300 [Vigna angularis]
MVMRQFQQQFEHYGMRPAPSPVAEHVPPTMARGTVYEAATVVHGVKLGEDEVKVSVDEVVVADAIVLVLTEDFFTRFVPVVVRLVFTPPLIFVARGQAPLVIALGPVADRGRRRSFSRRAWSRFVPVVVRLVCDHCHNGRRHRRHPHRLPRIATSGMPFFFQPLVVGEVLLF